MRPSTEEVGLADLRTRKKAVLDATQSMVQAFGVQDTADVLWLTKPRYIAHQIYVEGIEGSRCKTKKQRPLPSGHVTSPMRMWSAAAPVLTHSSVSAECHAPKGTGTANRYAKSRALIPSTPTPNWTQP